MINSCSLFGKEIIIIIILATPCSMWDLSSRPGREPGPPAVQARSHNHWTAREVLTVAFRFRRIKRTKNTAFL